MQAHCCHDPQNALVEEGVLSLPAMQARCCCDPQNALVEEGVLSCAAMQALLLIHRMLWWKKGVLSLRCHANKLLS
jgi:hypothetical protein